MTGSEYLLIGIALAALMVAGVAGRQGQRVRRELSRVLNERATLAAEARRLAGELQVTRWQLDGLGDAALDGLLLLDENRRILWGNSMAWEVCHAEQPAIGQAFIALVHDIELNQAVVDALEGGRPIVRQSGSDGRTLRIRAVPMVDTGAAVAIEDVTELQRLGRARRELVANISHELRTPLANIDLAAQTLRNPALDDPTLRTRMLDQIQSYVQTLSQLSQEMIDLAQIESGQVLLKLVPVAVEPLVQHAVRSLRPQAEVKRLSLQVEVPDDLRALADEQQVERVISNLVHNAIKFTPEGGKITITAGPVDDEDLQICVVDTGTGIPQAEQPRVFERFYKADRARSRGGTGLGLAIARHIVEGHGGRIWVESAPGQGAKFCFTLPRA